MLRINEQGGPIKNFDYLQPDLKTFAQRLKNRAFPAINSRLSPPIQKLGWLAQIGWLGHNQELSLHFLRKAVTLPRLSI